MPCRNARPFLREAVTSVLRQPECLELLVADGGSSDGSLQILEAWAADDPRLRIVSRADGGPADALNRAFQAARGTLMGWLNADDLYVPGALARATAAFANHPTWLMLYGEGMEFNAVTGLRQRYPTCPPEVGLQGFLSHCFISQPTVLFRRTMPLLLGPMDPQWQTAFDFDYWLRAFAAFPHRIGYIPQLQGLTRLHDATITSRQRARVALEATELLARHFGPQPAARLHSYALELQLGLASLPSGETLGAHLEALVRQCEPWLTPQAMRAFRNQWLLDPQTAPAMVAAEDKAAALALPSHLAVRLLQAVHPALRLEAPGPPAGPHLRLYDAVANHRQASPLLRELPIPPESAPRPISSSEHPPVPLTGRPFGVNLIGHAFEVFGIGEDIRMAARALQWAGVPCCVINHPAANGAPASDRALEPLLWADPLGGPFAFNLVCMAAPIQARWLLQTGFAPLLGRFTLVAWPWETQRWPEAWCPLLEVADELWPSSTFTAAALREPAAAAGLPLEVMPMAAEVPDPDRFCAPAVRRSSRASHGLPPDAVLFGYGFDFNSTALRKNPMGVLEAFQMAFPLPDLPAAFGWRINSHPLSRHVALMIKTFPPQADSAEWHWLRLRAAEDPRIHLVVANLERDDLLALYGCCDVFLSLHRSEGFGRGLAEALQLGLDVIATDYGGNQDFCHGPLAHPVRCQEVPIPRGAYPCADGHRWAEPDLRHAVEQIRQVAERRFHAAADPLAARPDPSRDPEVLSSYRERFSLAAAGARYRARLDALWTHRLRLAERIKQRPWAAMG